MGVGRGRCRKGANPGQRPQEGMSVWALGQGEGMETEEQAVKCKASSDLPVPRMEFELHPGISGSFGQ